MLSRYDAKATASAPGRVRPVRNRVPKQLRRVGRLAYDSPVLSVAYFGPAGTFTEEALLSQEDLAAGKRTPYASVPEVIAAVERHDADGGVVPIENMIEGSVSVTLDTLAFDSELLIQREIDLPVSLNLCAPAGVGLADVRTVVSFPHALAQCRGWLAKKLPAAEPRASHSTSDAAREVSRSKRRDLAAICNALAADLYGLEVLATDIEDHPENETRFVVVAREGVPAPTGHDKTTIVCFQQADRPGSLLAILQEFAARAINLTKIESRPTKQGLGDYCFAIDFEGHVADELVTDCLRDLRAKVADVKFLGSYPAAGAHGEAVRRDAEATWREADAWVQALRSSIADR